MHVSIAAEQRNEYGAVIKKHQPCQRGERSSRLAKKPKLDAAGIDNVSDPDDSDFMSDGLLAESLESEDGDIEVDEAQPSNAEVFIYDVLTLRSSLMLCCIDCRYPPFKNCSDNRTWVRKAKEEQTYC
jgi:hypothetical protein